MRPGDALMIAERVRGDDDAATSNDNDDVGGGVDSDYCKSQNH